MPDPYVYTLIDPRDQTPRYIGKGHNNRCSEHLTNSHNKQVKGWIANLRREGLEPDILYWNATTEKKAFWVERFLIALYGRIDQRTGSLFNHTNGGEGHSNPSPETREKLAAAKRGKKHSKQTKAKNAAAHRGLKHSEEHRAKISAALQGENNPYFGKVHPDEIRRKMSLAHLGKTLSPEHRARMSAGRIGVSNGPLSSEHRATLSAAHRGKPLSPEHRAKMTAAVRAYYAAKREQDGSQ